ncbi:GNAT family N-acetyltransferase [Pseudomonas mandelii]|uniref:GNAT family N-acetyltransferase n=1 Tax=Pseudomonas mandelii TaxID=75612 RepID=UPI00224AA93B|nr:GNAT family N-acetyltransferase [Pseudomonas mandelii]MCX2900228.1 GNAT family N-acetyltransferase [Pseudomonas mandelii]
MSDVNALNTLTLPDGRCLVADETSHRLSLGLDGQPLVALSLNREPALHVAIEQRFERPDSEILHLACYWFFASDPACQYLTWQLEKTPTDALSGGLLVTGESSGQYRCERALFWQLPQPWLRQASTGSYPQYPVISGGKRHPLRPIKPRGEVYRRFDARLGSWISLRTVDIEQDLTRFNRWQNSARVASFWQEEGSLEQHREYLTKLQADPHTLPLIGCFDDQPFAYFEAYWAKEDRIAPFYEAGDYDRGIHMLVGEEQHRGPHKVASWLAALTHYLFLDDPRTQRVVAEPRADNAKMIGYMQGQRYHCEKEFDFPHKRAALMVLGRERFFERCGLA